MPVYEYQCKACSRDFEYQQRITDPEMTTCEACGGALERLISRTAFALKGAGWYKDLYHKADGSFDPRKGKDYDKVEAKDRADQKKADENKPAGSDKADAKADTKSDGSGSGNGSGSSGDSGAGSGGSSGSTGGGSSGSVAKAS